MSVQEERYYFSTLEIFFLMCSFFSQAQGGAVSLVLSGGGVGHSETDSPIKPSERTHATTSSHSLLSSITEQQENTIPTPHTSHTTAKDTSANARPLLFQAKEETKSVFSSTSDNSSEMTSSILGRESNEAVPPTDDYVVIRPSVDFTAELPDVVSTIASTNEPSSSGTTANTSESIVLKSESRTHMTSSPTPAPTFTKSGSSTAGSAAALPREPTQPKVGTAAMAIEPSSQKPEPRVDGHAAEHPLSSSPAPDLKPATTAVHTAATHHSHQPTSTSVSISVGVEEPPSHKPAPAPVAEALSAHNHDSSARGRAITMDPKLSRENFKVQAVIISCLASLVHTPI